MAVGQPLDLRTENISVLCNPPMLFWLTIRTSPATLSHEYCSLAHPSIQDLAAFVEQFEKRMLSLDDGAFPGSLVPNLSNAAPDAESAISARCWKRLENFQCPFAIDDPSDIQGWESGNATRWRR